MKVFFFYVCIYTTTIKQHFRTIIIHSGFKVYLKNTILYVYKIFSLTYYYYFFISWKLHCCTHISLLLNFNESETIAHNNKKTFSFFLFVFRLFSIPFIHILHYILYVILCSKIMYDLKAHSVCINRHINWIENNLWYYWGFYYWEEKKTGKLLFYRCKLCAHILLLYSEITVINFLL